jgi:hypothetical protein
MLTAAQHICLCPCPLSSLESELTKHSINRLFQFGTGGIEGDNVIGDDFSVSAGTTWSYSLWAKSNLADSCQLQISANDDTEFGYGNFFATDFFDLGSEYEQYSLVFGTGSRNEIGWTWIIVCGGNETAPAVYITDWIIAEVS